MKTHSPLFNIKVTVCALMHIKADKQKFYDDPKDITRIVKVT